MGPADLSEGPSVVIGIHTRLSPKYLPLPEAIFRPASENSHVWYTKREFSNVLRYSHATMCRLATRLSDEFAARESREALMHSISSLCLTAHQSGPEYALSCTLYRLECHMCTILYLIPIFEIISFDMPSKLYGNDKITFMYRIFEMKDKRPIKTNRKNAIAEFLLKLLKKFSFQLQNYDLI